MQLKTPAVVVAAHFESMPGATPQSWSSAVGVVEVLVAEVQVVWLNWFNAVQVVARSEQMSAVWPSMLVAFWTPEYGRPFVKQLAGAWFAVSPCL